MKKFLLALLALTAAVLPTAAQNIPGISLPVLAGEGTISGNGTITIGTCSDSYFGWSNGECGSIAGGYSSSIATAAWLSDGSSVVIFTTFAGTLTLDGVTYPLTLVSPGVYQYAGIGLGGTYPTSGTKSYSIP